MLSHHGAGMALQGSLLLWLYPHQGSSAARQLPDHRGPYLPSLHRTQGLEELGSNQSSSVLILPGI